MEEQIIYTAKERYSGRDEVKEINVNIENIMSKLGGKVINMSYILSDGITTEAYGYYEFSRLGIVAISLKSSIRGYGNILPNIVEYTFCANFLGFEGKKEKYNNIKIYLEEALKRVGLKKVE